MVKALLATLPVLSGTDLDLVAEALRSEVS